MTGVKCCFILSILGTCQIQIKKIQIQIQTNTNTNFEKCKFKFKHLALLAAIRVTVLEEIQVLGQVVAQPKEVDHLDIKIRMEKIITIRMDMLIEITLNTF